MSIPDEMTAIGFDAPGGPEVLKPQKLPVPRPGEGEVLTRTLYLSLDPYMRGRLSDAPPARALRRLTHSARRSASRAVPPACSQKPMKRAAVSALLV